MRVSSRAESPPSSPESRGPGVQAQAALGGSEGPTDAFRGSSPPRKNTGAKLSRAGAGREPRGSLSGGHCHSRCGEDVRNTRGAREKEKISPVTSQVSAKRKRSPAADASRGDVLATSGHKDSHWRPIIWWRGRGTGEGQLRVTRVCFHNPETLLTSVLGEIWPQGKLLDFLLSLDVTSFESF